MRGITVVLAVFAVTVSLTTVGITREWTRAVFFAAGLGFSAAMLWLFNDRLTRWIVAPQSTVCPKCDYPVTDRTIERCSECGLTLR